MIGSAPAADGIFTIERNGVFADVDVLRGFANPGTAAVTATVYRRTSEGQGPQVRQQNVKPGDVAWLPDTFNPHQPLVVEIQGFVPAEGPPEGGGGEPAPQAPAVLRIPEDRLPLAEPPPGPRLMGAHVGFTVRCDLCDGTRVDVFARGGRVYFECNDCGACCRVKVGG